MKITREMVEACRESMGLGWGFKGLCWPAFEAIRSGDDKFDCIVGNYTFGVDQIELALAWIVTIGPCDLGD